MMLYPAMKDLLKKVPSRYELVNVVACRARKIASEAETAGVPLDDKPGQHCHPGGGGRKIGPGVKGEKAGEGEPCACFPCDRGWSDRGTENRKSRCFQGRLRY